MACVFLVGYSRFEGQRLPRSFVAPTAAPLKLPPGEQMLNIHTTASRGGKWETLGADPGYLLALIGFHRGRVKLMGI